MGSCRSCVRCLSFIYSLSYDNLSSPHNLKELFNLRHASACNVVERIFGILKRRFQILRIPLEYSMGVQAQIPPALAALHNFIWQYNPQEIQMYDDELRDESLELQMALHPESAEELRTVSVTPNERRQVNKRRDKIADDMWEQYQDYLKSGAAHDG